jgi:Tc toxin complex TcA C-terminal TcB-binding domain
MAIQLGFNSPAAGAHVGTNLACTGFAFDDGQPFPGDPGGGQVSIVFTFVTFGTNGQNVNVHFVDGQNWTCSGTLPQGTHDGDTTTLTVTCRGLVTFSDDPGENHTFDESASINVVLETPPTQLTVIQDYPVDVVPPTLPFQVTIHGTTSGAVSGVTEVRLSLDGGAGVLAEDLTGDWSQWRVQLSLPAGDHTFIVTAHDSSGRTVSSMPGRILVHEPFEPTDPAIVFGPTIYVRELSDFIGQYVLASGAGGPVSPDRALLTARFRQPYDKLPDIASYQAAVAAVDQRRVAVEVLRRYLTSPAPAATDQSLRRLAYESLLRELGTSTVELRQARAASQDQRVLLADRLGIELGSSRPDHLDELTLDPDAITDAQLEGLFGFRSMLRTDPFEPLGAPPAMQTWRQAALRGLWRAEDGADRDGGSAGPLPVIDPDNVAAANLVSQQSGDLAHDLWAARQALLQSLASQIDAAVSQGKGTAATFDQLVRTHIGNIDLLALAARDSAGEDITATLAPLGLSLAGFRYLVGAKELLAAGPLLASEWIDVRDVLVQAHKVRLYATWRQEERAADIVLEPQRFVLDGLGGPAAGSPWRTDFETHLAWQRTLAARVAQLDALGTDLTAVVRAAEATTLPAARDALVALIGSRHSPAETPDQAADRLTRELCIDLRADSTVLTTHADQAAQTLLEALIALRSGSLPASTDGQTWGIAAGKEPLFDREWLWMGSYTTWYAAITAFAFPDNQLFPGLYLPGSAPQNPSTSYLQFLADLRAPQRLTPQRARDLAQANWNRVLPTLSATLRGALTDPNHPLPLTGDQITELHTNSQLDALRITLAPLFGADNEQVLRELFWLVPVALGLALTNAGEYTAALDWFQYAYGYPLPAANRRVFPGLARERDIKSTFGRSPAWPADGTNPHEVALERANVYTRFTIISIAKCLLAYADNEFIRNTAEADARARTLYETAFDLLGNGDAAPETTGPFPANPLLGSLRDYARTSLDKIHRGLNIATTVQADNESVQPSQYRYSVLADRAKNLAATAAQLEAAFLAAAEQADAGAYSALQASHDLEVARAILGENDLKVSSAAIGVELATSQHERAGIQADHFAGLLAAGPNAHERSQLDDLEAARDLAAAGGILSGIGSMFPPSPVSVVGGLGAIATGLSQAASLDAQIEGTEASFDRRQEDWQLQASLGKKDVEIGKEQIALASTQQQIAQLERDTANLQLTFATATANFVATKFTSAELFEWMSGVLNQVYAYFLRQATAVARLAQAQLAFERQEPNRGLVQGDYWQGPPDPNTGQSDTTDRRGLTGSARLLEDLTRLDQYAFETNRRKLHLTQTFSVAQLAGAELQSFRQTGVLTVATPEELYDRRFPGHYLRLVSSVKVSVIALVPPVTGVSATLSSSGVSRAVVSRGLFETVTLRRDPEAIAFTSPSNATGLFELETDTGLLRPFEGMGVDAVWRLEMPKAANQFDYRTIADVLLTVEYTALDSPDHRHTVIRGLNRRFSGDRLFSVRQQFPDVWYALNNPDTVEDGQRMLATVSLTRDDLPPQLDGLAVGQLTLFAVRSATLLDEVTVTATHHVVNGQTTSAGPVTTVGGIAGTRRLNGEPWLVYRNAAPTGDWQFQFPDTPTVRSWFTGGLLEDLVLAFTVTGTTPAWP